MIITEVNGKEIVDDLFSARDKQLIQENEINNKNKDESLVNSMNKLDIKETKPKKERKPRTPKEKN